MTIPKFRELLANFQAQAEAYLEQGGPFATADTGFMKRRDHLAELQKVRDEAAAVVQKYRDEAESVSASLQAVRLQRDAAQRLLNQRTEELKQARTKVRSLSGKLSHANQRAVQAEARLLEYGIELKPAKLPAKFRKKAETWIDRLRARASQPEQ